MQHCNQEWKPLQGFASAAPKCRGLGAQPPWCRGFEGAAPQGARGSEGRSPRDARVWGAVSPRYIGGVRRAAVNRGSQYMQPHQHMLLHIIGTILENRQITRSKPSPQTNSSLSSIRCFSCSAPFDERIYRRGSPFAGGRPSAPRAARPRRGCARCHRCGAG